MQLFAFESIFSVPLHHLSGGSEASLGAKRCQFSHFQLSHRQARLIRAPQVDRGAILSFSKASICAPLHHLSGAPEALMGANRCQFFQFSILAQAVSCNSCAACRLDCNLLSPKASYLAPLHHLPGGPEVLWGAKRCHFPISNSCTGSIV